LDSCWRVPDEACRLKVDIDENFFGDGRGIARIESTERVVAFE
jgi:hypothetical protein